MDNLPKTKKSLGQHWLTDTASLMAMIEAVEVTSNDTVVEIGPGPGTLTKPLAAAAGQVIAVEFDSILAANLGAKVGATNLKVVHDDILRFDFSTIPAPYKVVANIPYYLTSNLIRRMSETANPPVAAALLVQKEVAQRVAAKPGDMSLLSVTAQFYWDATVGMEVPARLFKPAPKVDSQILIMNRLASNRFDDVVPTDFFRLVKAGFSERRKTLSNSLSGGLRLSKSEANILLERAGINQRLRPQNLSLEDWHKLYKVL